ncbi:MAG: hypothetical protein DRJ10_07045 [Bacteroidetes bacterium]|nr:MAG: hypothetical protein DRJ10_07045 [Bacteroidota bacterium]
MGIKLLSITIVLALSSSLFAQNKEYKKLKSYFDEKKYEKCIESSLKSIKKEPKEIFPALYASLAYFEQFKIADDKYKSKNLRNALKYAAKAKKLDKKGVVIPQYSTYYSELKESSLKYGDEIFYSENKDKSCFIYDYLVKIYEDTTTQYRDFHPESKKNISSEVGLNVRTEKVNQIDDKGHKQGFWTKKYRNGVVAYEVTFKDNKPVGDYKRYHENGKINAYLVYDNLGEWADAKLYDDNGKIVAEGKYFGKFKDGLWVYSHNGKKVAEENFKMGNKNGVSKSFFENGSISEEKNWKAGVENGVWRQYYNDGKKRLESRIDNGKRNSAYYLYYQSGRVKIRGRYKNDRMDGKWIYSDFKGEIVKEIYYMNGVAENQDELDEKEQEVFKQFEENRKRLKDPKDYINNPYEYMRDNGFK